jgi:sigma-E factor negative regulatory protein RseA
MGRAEMAGKSVQDPDGKRGEALDESLSALMDDQAQEMELRRLLRDMDRCSDACEATQQSWYRQHLVRAALHGEPVTHAPNFAASVRVAIDSEVQEDAPAGSWRRSVSSFAVAASVAAVVVVGGQQLVTGNGDTTEALPGIAALPVGVVNTTGAVPMQASFGSRTVPASSQTNAQTNAKAMQPADRASYRELARQRLQRYSWQHAEHASLNTPHGLLPFARVPVIEGQSQTQRQSQREQQQSQAQRKPQQEQQQEQQQQ